MSRCASSVAVQVNHVNLAIRKLCQRSFDCSNQDINTNNDERIISLGKQFNHMGIDYSFAYGLGVFQQAGYSKSASVPQVDMIHIVENPQRFHRINAVKNPSHYSSLIHFGDATVNWIQECGAGVYFNPYVKMKGPSGEEITAKYGVVSTNNALSDIQNWTSLYIAGRLQKPVKHLLDVSDDLKIANEYNLESAFNLSLLIILKKTGSNLVTPAQIFEQIALISYMGDPRMLIGGENPNKVKNIVVKQLPYFEQLYSKAIDRAIKNKYLSKHGKNFDIILNGSSAASIVASLPNNFRRKFLSQYKKKLKKTLALDKQMSQFLDHSYNESFPTTSHANSRYILEAVSEPSAKWAILNTVLSIIAIPALAQSVKGILTAGVVKSVKYAWEKRLKSFGT